MLIRICLVMKTSLQPNRLTKFFAELYLLTTFAAAALVVGLGFAIAPAHAAPLPQLNGPSNQASPVEKIGYYGYRRYGYYPRHRYYWRPRYYRPYYGYGYYRPYRYGYWNRPYYRRWW
jgi:hypothetical protein